MRTIESLNGEWNFRKEGHDFSVINVPHTWNVIDGQGQKNDYFQGKGEYEKVVYIKDLNKNIFIECKGVSKKAEIYVNKKYVGEHRGGFSTFRFDITSYVNINEDNLITIIADNTNTDEIYPMMADFTFFGGVYRDVNIIYVNETHFDLLDDGSKGVYVQSKIEDNHAIVNISNVIVGDYDFIDASIIDEKGDITCFTQTVDLNFDMIMFQPTLWEGKKNPYLYTLSLTIFKEGNVCDEIDLRFGVRSIAIDASTGFALNNENMRLNGVSRHQCREDFGWALTKEHHEEDLELIKELGANSIRLAHYQHDDYFYDLCDEAGMILWAEIPFISGMSNNPLAFENAKQQMRELIKQNMHRPSIAMWGIQNEITIRPNEKLKGQLEGLQAICKELDPTRLTTAAQFMAEPNNSELNSISDILGYNLYWGWYAGKTEDFGPWLDRFHSENPTIPLSISEYGAEGILAYQNDQPVVKDYSEAYHALFHEEVFEILHKKEYLWGTYVWNMFDFAAANRDEGGVKGRNNKGLITFDRKTKKDAFYLYQAYFSEVPMLHVAGKRYEKRNKDVSIVKVYSNQEHVEFYHNNIEISGNRRGVIFTYEVPVEKENHILVKAGMKHEVLYFSNAEEPVSYSLGNATGGSVQNWMDDLLHEELFPAGYYNVRCTIGEMFHLAEIKHILTNIPTNSMIGDLMNSPMLEVAKGFTLEQMAGHMKNEFPKEKLMEMNEILNKIPRVS